MPGKRLTHEQRALIEARGREQVPAKKIATEARTSGVTVLRVLKAAGIQVRTQGQHGPRIVPVEAILALVDAGEHDYKRVAAILGIGTQRVHYVLRRHRGSGKIADLLTRREDFLDLIDTQEKAYFYGLLIAEGNTSGRRLGFGLNVEDSYLVERFRAALNSECKTYLRPNGFRMLYVTSERLSDRARALGVVLEKAQRFIVEDAVPVSLRSHFIRGLFDGDGDLGRGSRTGYFGLAGSPEALEVVLRWLEEAGCLESAQHRPKRAGRRTYRVRIYAERSRNLIRDYLYKDAEPDLLHRGKHQRFYTPVRDWAALRPPRVQRIDRLKVWQMTRAGHSMGAIGKAMNCSSSTIWRHLQGEPPPGFEPSVRTVDAIDRLDLRLGDAFALLPSVQERSIDLVLTDPPWSEEAHERAQRDDSRWFKPFSEEQLVETLRQLARVAKRWVVLASTDPKFTKLVEQGIPDELAFVRWGVWAKPDYMRLGWSAPHSGWEPIAFLHRIGERRRWHGGGRGVAFAHSSRGLTSAHPTPKPVPLYQEIIELFSDPNDLVLDPFAGSGTTLLAAARSGRRCLAFELEQRYYELAQKRLARFGSEDPKEKSDGKDHRSSGTP